MPARPTTAPIIRPSHDVATEASSARRAWSRRTSARGTSGRTCRHARDLQGAGPIAATRQRAHRHAHRHPSPRRCGARPGKPTSVSSTSPVAGLVGCGRVVEVAVLELLGLCARLAVEGAEDHPERVDGGHERAHEASTPSTECQPPRSNSIARISSFEKTPQNGITPDSARPPTIKQRVRQGHRLAEPPICRGPAFASIARINQPATKKRSALKNACVIRWKRRP